MSALPEFENHAEQTVKTTTCYMCACRCGIKVTLEGNEIRFIQGNPKHPVNKGVLCAKGNAGIMKQKSPAKLTQPLVRKAGTERGAGEFEPISWEKALDLLTERLRKIRATDPKAGAVTSHFRLLDGTILNHEVQIVSGVADAECGDLLRAFFRARRS